MQRLHVVLKVLSLVIMVFSATMLVPLALAFCLQDPALHAYDKAVAITLGSGFVMWMSTRRSRSELQIRDGFLLVTLVWAVLPAFAALPLMFHLPQISFTDAYFECMAGITTTGSTVLSNLDGLPPSINLWRALLQWLGGMGIIVLVVAVLPLLGVGGRQIYKAETPGPMKDNKLTPRITETAKGLWLVYAGITVACIIAFRLAGMGWLDAVVHGFATMSLGGFSAHDASFGYFNSPLIETIAIFFMLVAGINFATHFLAWRQRSYAPYKQDPEAKYFLLITLGSCVMLALFLWLNGVYPDFLAALRYASFNTVSIATTTGFANADFDLWPVFAPLWMLFLGSFVSSSGSTGGGIKMIRAQLLFLQGLREMVKLIHPHAQVPVKVGGQTVPNQIVYAVLAYMSLYGASVVAMTFLLLVSGLDFITALSAILACINNTGPGLNQVGPAMTFGGLTDVQTWICSIAMLVGRLELLTVFVIFTPAFWRK